ncbi:MAG TPA: sulfatase [Lacunisphaera sp.]
MKFRPSLLVLFLLLTSVRAADRPNILWIVSEDNAVEYLRLYAAGGAEMPNIERLAAGGLVFDRAFANSPVCSTSRSSIITGSYAPRIGAMDHRRSQHAPMPEGLRMFPWYLRQAGYYTSNNVKTDYNLRDRDMWDESSDRATWRKRKEGQPFFHVQNFTTTHESSLHFTAEEMAADKLDLTGIALTPYQPDTPVFRYTKARYLARHRLLDRQIGELLAQLEADGLAGDTIIFYYGDHGGVMPRSKGYIFESGLHVPLVVHAPEKWRHLLPAAPGSRLPGFVSFIDLAPTVLNLAGLKPPAAMDGRAFLGAGVTAENLAQRDENYSAADRFDEKYDLVRGLRKGRFKYLRNYQPFNPDALNNTYRFRQPAYAEWRELFRAGRLDAAQRAFFEPRLPESLFDLEKDPHEVHNLAADPAYAVVLADLRGRLAAWVKGMPDLGFYPENIFLKDAIGNPVAYGREHREQIARLVDTADLALRPFAGVRPALEQALASTDPWTRYWALIACSTHGPAAAALAPAARRLAADDPERLVRVRAAEFLALIRAEDPHLVIARALREVADPVEANLILNTVVMLRDSPVGYAGKIQADWFPAEWLANARNQFLLRLEYLEVPFDRSALDAKRDREI